MRQTMIWLTHRHCRVEFRGPVYLGPGFHLQIPDRGELIIGPGVDFRRGFVCEISGNGRVTIGGGSVFTSHALIQCSTVIEIGERCVFGQSLMIADGSHRFRDWTQHVLDQGYDYQPIRIGDNAVVMTKVTIAADIGRNAVIGANALVNRPIPPFCFAGGVPARVIEYFGPPDQRPPELDAGRHG
jgi:acetyltransferase-like isoleucine patch superfamily enzyme